MRDAVIDRRRRLFVYPLRRATNSREVPPDVRAPAGWLRCSVALVGVGLSFGLAGCGVVASSDSSTPSHPAFAPIGQDSGTGDGAGNGESGGGAGGGAAVKGAGDAAGGGGRTGDGAAAKDTGNATGGDRHKGDGAAVKGSGGTAGGGRGTSDAQAASEDEFGEDFWLYSRPTQDLGDLVKASEKFKGKPLNLRPIDGEDVDPMFVGKPDPCDPQIAQRLESIGMKTFSDIRMSGPGIYGCNYGIPATVGLPHSVAHMRTMSNFSNRATKDFGDDLYAIEDGTWIFTCVAVQQTDPDTVHYFTYSNRKDDDVEYHCDTVRKLRQIFNNVYGGKLQ